jgi:hypothetical protein
MVLVTASARFGDISNRTSGRVPHNFLPIFPDAAETCYPRKAGSCRKNHTTSMKTDIIDVHFMNKLKYIILSQFFKKILIIYEPAAPVMLHAVHVALFI